MTTYALLHTIFFFFVYAFLGWCVEVAYAAITTRELVNRGFLNGPICPIYGCGMTVMIAVLGRFTMPSSDMAWYQNVLVAFFRRHGHHHAGGAGWRVHPVQDVPHPLVGLFHVSL